jgi:hypothetical protein
MEAKRGAKVVGLERSPETTSTEEGKEALEGSRVETRIEGGEGRASSWVRREEPTAPVAPMMRILGVVILVYFGKGVLR